MIRNRRASNDSNITLIPSEEFVDRKTAAKILGVKDQTLSVWACHKRHDLPYYKIGRLVRYKVADLLAFLENGRVE